MVQTQNAILHYELIYLDTSLAPDLNAEYKEKLVSEANRPAYALYASEIYSI